MSQLNLDLVIKVEELFNEIKLRKYFIKKKKKVQILNYKV